LKQSTEHLTRSLLSRKYRVDLNSVRINTHNKKEHEMAKCSKAYDLIKDGHSIVTEAIFVNNKRADIIDLCCGRVFEILYSETYEEALEKTKSYPKELDILYFKAEEILEEK